MTSRAALDTSPPSEAHPPIEVRRPLKRSASTASLPTPPRTRHRHRHAGARSLSRGSVESSSEEEGGHSGEEDGNPNKKRKLEDDEEEFWMGKSARSRMKKRAKASATVRPEQHSPARSPSPAPAFLQRRQNGGAVLASPPPSRRSKPPVATVRVTTPPVALELTATAPTTPKTVSPPVTPKPRASTSKAEVKTVARDSPENPFLDSEGSEGLPAVADRDVAPRTSPVEKPTLTYVFRGVRAEFANPRYHGGPLSPSRTTASRLPIDHPEYSPDMACPPKLLFPPPRRSSRKQSTTPKRRAYTARTSPTPPGRQSRRSPSVDPASTDEEDTKIPAVKLFPVRERSPRTREGTLIGIVGERGVEVEGGRDDPIKRAMGPRR